MDAVKKPHSFYRADLEIADHETSEKALKRDLSRIIKPSGVVFDVGANRGQFANQILQELPDIKLYCFEPVSEAYNELTKINEKYKQVRTFPYAVSEKSGTADFFIMESDVGSSLLEPLSGQPSQWLTPSRKEIVKTKRLDEFIEEEGINKINLLKCDAQGHDLGVLLSSGNYLDPNFIDSVLVEINFATFYKGQDKVGDIINKMGEKGFRLAWLYPHRAHDEWLWWADALFLPINNNK